MTFSFNDAHEDTPANRTAFLDELYRLEKACEDTDATAKASGVSRAPPDHYPVLLVTLNGKIGLIRPCECRADAFALVQFARGVVTQLNCRVSQLSPK